MNKKSIVNILIVGAIIAVIVLLAVLTFVDFDALKKKEFTVKYEATAGGRIEGNTNQIIQEGKDGETVTAVPDEGYRFLRWLDTCNPNPVRTETNINDNLKPQAKFVKISDIKYKILLVYVTEVQATFADIDGNDIVADYKMSDKDLAACRMTTELFDVCLNELFDGLVTFEIDEYYTKQVMREENFNYTVLDREVDAALYAENIPEIVDMLDHYGSCLTTVSLNDPYRLLTFGAGSARVGSATVKDPIPTKMTPDGETIRCYDLVNTYNNHDWVNIIETYLHEFVHTVEMKLSSTYHYAYHNVISKYNAEYKNENWYRERYLYTISKLYLLNQAEYEGRTVGIPFPVWTNEIYSFRYIIGDKDMGAISTKVLPTLYVAKGCDGEEMEAIAYPGYKFVGWSDGVTTATRTDKNIQGDMEVTAYFEPIEYTITYIASDGGRIDGMTNQKCLGASAFESVTAVANEGYRFVGWSDGELDEHRQDSTYGNNVDRFDENDCLELTAIFEPI